MLTLTKRQCRRQPKSSEEGWPGYNEWIYVSTTYLSIRWFSPVFADAFLFSIFTCKEGSYASLQNPEERAESGILRLLYDTHRSMFLTVVPRFSATRK